MIVSFSQPVFIPWGGFFCRLSASDRMILLDDTLFAQGFTFVNRNRLKGSSGETWVTVPIKKKGRGRQKIKDLEIYHKEYWGKKFLTGLAYMYGKSIYFEQVYQPLRRIIEKQDDHFLNMALEILESMKTHLGIETPFSLQSEMGIAERGVNLLVDIAGALHADEVILPYPARSLVDCRQFEKHGIKENFLKFVAPIYPQFYGEFVSSLSALDLLFSLGPDGRKLLERSYTPV